MLYLAPRRGSRGERVPKEGDRVGWPGLRFEGAMSTECPCRRAGDTARQGGVPEAGESLSGQSDGPEDRG